MKRMTYAKVLMCLLFSSATSVVDAQHAAGELKCKLTGRMLMDGGIYFIRGTADMCSALGC